jgi:4-hydroxy-3-methylbut-2-enyl diphosphate reductase
MEVKVGKYVGFCSGVKRAIKGVSRALEENSKIYCIGEIIHNPEVIKSLKQRGLEMVDDIDSIPVGSHLIIRSHGVRREIIEKAKKRGLRIHDFTCPKVKKIHNLVEELEKEGYNIIVIGNKHHPEVQAIASIATREVHVLERPESFKLPPSGVIAVVVQTTFNPELFSEIVKKIVVSSKKILIYNTLCEETLKRQKEALRVAREVDFLIVVGGKNSSNTKTLYDLIKTRVPSLHIESSGELDNRMFKNIRRVGVISGASTPKEEVMNVAQTLRSFD